MSTYHRVRAHGDEGHHRGVLVMEFGIVVGTVEQYAEALGCSCGAVADTLAEQAMIDTAQNANHLESHTRPSDPSLRTLAVTRDVFAEALATHSMDMP